MRILAFLYATRFPKGHCFSSKLLSASTVSLPVNRQSRFEDENKNGRRMEQILYYFIVMFV